MKNGEDAVLCNIIYSSGSAPRKEGSKMAVFRDKSILGTIGGGIVEFEAINRALELLEKKENACQKYVLNQSDVSGLGAVCGGEITVYFRYLSCDRKEDTDLIKELSSAAEKLKDTWMITSLNSGSIGIYDDENGLRFSDVGQEKIKPYLDNCTHLTQGGVFIEPVVISGFVYIFGGGHISQALVPVLSKLGYRCIILENRDEFLKKELFSGVYDSKKIDFKKPGEYISAGEKDHIIIMTRGHESDFDVLEFALSTRAGYIGLIGSRSKWKYTVERLEKDGFTQKDCSRVYNPIGIPIGAQTPDEIAISIAAQLIKHRYLGD